MLTLHSDVEGEPGERRVSIIQILLLWGQFQTLTLLGYSSLQYVELLKGSVELPCYRPWDVGLVPCLPEASTSGKSGADLLSLMGYPSLAAAGLFSAKFFWHIRLLHGVVLD